MSEYHYMVDIKVDELLQQVTAACPAEDETYEEWFLIIYAIVVILGILGNMLVIMLIAALPRLRTPPNIFVLNLCIADLLLGLNAIFAFAGEIDTSWVLDTGACRIFGFLGFMPPIAVVLSMVIVAKIRHKAITSVCPVKMTRCRISIYLALIWVISAIISLPILLGWVSVKSGLFCACCFYFRENLIYGIVVTTSVYVIPNILIAYYYIRIFIFVHKSRVRVEQHTSGQGTAKKADIRLAVQFIVLFLIFNLCYMPTMIVFWVEDEHNTLPDAVNAVVMLIFALNLVLNPLVYFAFNKGAQHEVRRCCKKSSEWSGDTRSQDGARDSHAMRSQMQLSGSIGGGGISGEQSGSDRNQLKDDVDSVGSKSNTISDSGNSSLETLTRPVGANSYLLIAYENSLAAHRDNGCSSGLEHSVNNDKGQAPDKEPERPPLNATVFLEAQANYLAVPRTAAGRVRRGRGGDTLRLERLSVVSVVESIEGEHGGVEEKRGQDGTNMVMAATVTAAAAAAAAAAATAAVVP